MAGAGSSRRTGGDLVGLLNATLKARPEHLSYDPKKEDSRLVLTEAYRARLDGCTHTEWVFSIVADEAPGEYPPGFEDEPFLQGGGCPRCAVELSSHAKGPYVLCAAAGSGSPEGLSLLLAPLSQDFHA